METLPEKALRLTGHPAMLVHWANKQGWGQRHRRKELFAQPLSKGRFSPRWLKQLPPEVTAASGMKDAIRIKCNKWYMLSIVTVNVSKLQNSHQRAVSACSDTHDLERGGVAPVAARC